MADEFNGWVKLWRSIAGNPRRRDPDWLAVWVDFLINATHKAYDVVFDGNRRTLLPGQMITGRNAQAARTGVNASKVRRIWETMKTDQQISQEAGVTSSIFTILKWADYQADGQLFGQRVDNDRTTSGQRVDTNKNVKKVENDKTKTLVGLGVIIEEPEPEGGYHKDSRTVLHYLNERCGRHFRETDGNLKFISARLEEGGVTLQGVMQMITRQCARWKGTGQEEYLRPETLFNKTKFDGYYAAKDLPISPAGGAPEKPPTLLDKEIERLKR